MKKVSKVLFLCVMTCVLMVFGSINATAASKTITIKSAKKITNAITNYNQDFVIYKTKDKKTMYGLEFDKKVLKKNAKLTFDKNADAGLLYILENGYPKSKITSDSSLDKYITEAAIWLYMDETNQGKSVNSILKNEKNNKDTNGLVHNYIKPLVENAIKAKEDNYEAKKPSMKVLSGENSLYLSKNRKYYESDYIAVKLVGAKTYTVSSDATILDVNGKKKKKFSAYEMFKVKIPVSKISNNKISINIKASGKENIAKIYNPKNSKYQSLVGLFTKKHNLKEKITLSFKITPDCKYIDGNYHDKNGNVTDEQTYKNDCNKSCKIVNENYYGINGEETSKLIFDKECSNSCVVDGDDLYGIGSRMVDEFTFEKECPGVNIAKTTKDNKSNNKIVNKKEEKAEKDNTSINNENKTNEQNIVNPESTLEVEVPDTDADVSLFNIVFGTLLVLMGIGVLYRRNKILN
ncbi:MAG: Cys-Gln thioester bond-forming surface protein [Bacilli bacterium]|nr:Cys-Gln thioester bond-forming surface protein [Bacilli bacterium]